jgi:hypothetical protein
MLRIRAATSPQYYEQREFARDDYYSEHERTPGQWVGRGAALLELRGAPEPGELAALLDGQHKAPRPPCGPAQSWRFVGHVPGMRPLWTERPRPAPACRGVDPISSTPARANSVRRGRALKASPAAVPTSDRP